jgi:putative oxidoreductase
MAASTSDVVLLIGRILLGWIFVRSGYGKIFDIPAYAATFPPRGMPAFLAYLSVPAEFFGGIALILGLATRYVVLVMIIFMLGATYRYWEFTDVAVRPPRIRAFTKTWRFWADSYSCLSAVGDGLASTPGCANGARGREPSRGLMANPPSLGLASARTSSRDRTGASGARRRRCRLRDRCISARMAALSV